MYVLVSEAHRKSNQGGICIMNSSAENRRYRIILKKDKGQSKAVNGKELKNYANNHLQIIAALEQEHCFEDDNLAAWWINKKNKT